MPPRRGKVILPSLLGAMANHSVESPAMVRCRRGGPPSVRPITTVLEPSPRGGEAQAAEAISDELKAPKMNGFVEGKATARQTFTVGNDSKHR
jgi:hypothetical protein